MLQGLKQATLSSDPAHPTTSKATRPCNNQQAFHMSRHFHLPGSQWPSLALAGTKTFQFSVSSSIGFTWPAPVLEVAQGFAGNRCPPHYHPPRHAWVVSWSQPGCQGNRKTKRKKTQPPQNPIMGLILHLKTPFMKNISMAISQAKTFLHFCECAMAPAWLAAWLPGCMGRCLYFHWLTTLETK